MKTLIALAAVLVTGSVSLAQCNKACAPAQSVAPQYVAPQAQVVQAQTVAVPSALFVVPSAPQVQIVQQPVVVQQVAPIVVAQPVVVAQPLVVQKQVVQKVVQQRAAIIQPAQRQRSFSLQRSVIR